MFDAISDDLAGMADVYSELSEYTHFQRLAVYNAHAIEDEVDPRARLRARTVRRHPSLAEHR